MAVMTLHQDLLGGPPPTLMPDDSPARDALAAGSPAAQVAADHPAVPLPWAVLAEQALDAGEHVQAYAYARTGYHRGLDLLRRSGWKGHGPVPWEHEPNRGWLRALHALAQAAAGIGEEPEAQRCAQFLVDSSPEAAEALTAGR
jgi:hypothetical protein